MSIEQELFYQEFVQRENEILRAPYNPELEFYSAIKAGDTAKVQELCKEQLHEKEGLGTLSNNSLQNIKYHFVVTTALTARYCIDGGMEVSAAYSLSDFYIQKADSCKTISAVSNLHPIMCMDYARRMKSLRRNKICSKHITECLDYIYDHLHTRITIEDLASYLHLNPSYLSRLFKKEVGIPISNYIQQKKIETAKNMLTYSEHSLASIASTLAFPSQSYFTELFHRYTGVTPTEYRARNFRTTEIHPHNHE